MAMKIDEINNIETLIAKLPNKIDIGKNENKNNKKLFLFIIFFVASIFIILKLYKVNVYLACVELLIHMLVELLIHIL